VHPTVARASCAALAATVLSVPIAAGTAAATPAPRVEARANSAGTPAAELVAHLAYRGAEHPFLVGQLASTSARFGAGSVQSATVAKALATNGVDLARTVAPPLVGPSRDRAIAVVTKVLTGRDRAELAYAGGITAGRSATTSAGAAAARSRVAAAIRALTATEVTLAHLVHNRYPSISTDQARRSMTAVDAVDLVTLKDIATGNASRFGYALRSADAASVLFAALGAAQVLTDGVAGDSNAPGSVYRARLTTAFVEHVYETGLVADVALLTGLRSGQTLAAERAEDGNSQRIAGLLGDPVGKQPEDLSAWRSHIASGYAAVINYYRGGKPRTELAKGNRALTKYVERISADVHALAPSLSVADLKMMYGDHTAGTVVVIAALEAQSAKAYSMAFKGAEHFRKLASMIAVKAAAAGHIG